MLIDEERKRSILSDHNLLEIVLDIGDSKCTKGSKKEIVSTCFKKAAELTRGDLERALANAEDLDYNQFVGVLKGNAGKCTKRITVNEKHGVWSKDIAKLDRKKREISKSWRKARKRCDAEAEELFQRVKEVQNELSKEIKSECAKRDKRLHPEMSEKS